MRLLDYVPCIVSDRGEVAKKDVAHVVKAHVGELVRVHIEGRKVLCPVVLPNRGVYIDGFQWILPQ